MTKDEFRLLFESALSRAVSAFYKVYSGTEAKPATFELHAPKYAGGIVSEHEALKELFLSDNSFYRVIDLGLIPRESAPPMGFIRVSGHAPGPYEETLNPADLGPFNILEPLPKDQIPGIR
jgi:hypothetical protein